MTTHERHELHARQRAAVVELRDKVTQSALAVQGMTNTNAAIAINSKANKPWLGKKSKGKKGPLKAETGDTTTTTTTNNAANAANAATIDTNPDTLATGGTATGAAAHAIVIDGDMVSIDTDDNSISSAAFSSAYDASTLTHNPTARSTSGATTNTQHQPPSDVSVNSAQVSRTTEASAVNQVADINAHVPATVTADVTDATVSTTTAVSTSLNAIASFTNTSGSADGPPKRSAADFGLAGSSYTKLRAGDTLLLEMPRAYVDTLRSYKRHFASVSILRLYLPSQRDFVQEARFCVSLACLVVIFVLPAIGVQTLLTLALATSCVCVAIGCITVNQAWQSINYRVLLTIAASYGLGAALQTTKVAKFLSIALTDLGTVLPPVAFLFAVFFFTAMLSCVVSNAATVVLLYAVLRDSDVDGLRSSTPRNTHAAPNSDHGI
eukprot:3334284-Pleurochrysis_carterae.AAC.2